jgi:hypothetical protein
MAPISQWSSASTIPFTVQPEVVPVATRDQMISAIGDKADSTGIIHGWPTAKVKQAYEALPASVKPKAPKSTESKPKAKSAQPKALQALSHPQRETMIAALIKDNNESCSSLASKDTDQQQRYEFLGWSTASLEAAFALLEMPKITLSEPKAEKKSPAELFSAVVSSYKAAVLPRMKLIDKLSKGDAEIKRKLAGFSNAALAKMDTDQAVMESIKTEPKAEKGTMNGYAVKGVAVKPIMEEWTKSVSDEVTMQSMLENIRLAFLEGRHHYGNELIQAAKEAC